jgi:hypothetical protein
LRPVLEQYFVCRKTAKGFPLVFLTFVFFDQYLPGLARQKSVSLHTDSPPHSRASGAAIKSLRRQKIWQH